MVENPPANARDIRGMGLIPGSGRSSGGRHGNLLQYSCLENPMDRGAWRNTAHEAAKSWTRLRHMVHRGLLFGTQGRSRRMKPFPYKQEMRDTERLCGPHRDLLSFNISFPFTSET